MKEELLKRLKVVALQKTKPFCYSCYVEAPSGRCSRCGSDDIMRLLPGFGCEYGTDWVVKEILGEITPVDLNERFEDSMRDCYPEETKIGWLTYDTLSAIKELDPISWDIAKGEWVDSQDGDEGLITFDEGSTYFDSWQVLMYLEDKESPLADKTT